MRGAGRDTAQRDGDDAAKSMTDLAFRCCDRPKWIVNSRAGAQKKCRGATSRAENVVRGSGFRRDPEDFLVHGKSMDRG